MATDALTLAVREIAREEVAAQLAKLMNPSQLRGALAAMTPRVTVREASIERGIPMSTIRGWVAEDRFKTARRANGRGDWTIERAEWDAFVDGPFFDRLARRRVAKAARKVVDMALGDPR